jgi:ACS family hexuronate transporter-like MFS transporter
MPSPAAALPPARRLVLPRDRHRWLVCGLLLAAVTLNYLDRQVLAILSSSPEFRAVTGFGPVQYGYAHSMFQAAYALALPLAGWLVDRVGTRAGYTLIMALWSLADMAHALARGTGGFFAARFALGLGEAGAFPSAIKAIAERFPQREVAFATSVCNAGTSLGALAAPLLVPWLYAHLGWRGPFVATGLLGFAWIVAWARLGARPAASAPSGPATAPEGAGPRVGWGTLLRQRNTWAIAVGKLLTDPIWFFYLAWLPPFLGARHGIRIDTIGLPLATIYLLSDAGSLCGGWMAGRLMRRGLSAAAARRAVMLAAALLGLPTLAAAGVSHLWGLVALVGLATAAHQAWSANLFSLASDLFPRAAVGRVVGLAGMAGSLGGVVFSALVGHLVAGGGGYRVVFAIASSAYLIAWVAIQLLITRPAPGAGAASPQDPSIV